MYNILCAALYLCFMGHKNIAGVPVGAGAEVAVFSKEN